MGRRKQGWQLYLTAHGTYHVRFRHAGERYKLTTGERDIEAAQVEAARVYREITRGQGRPATRREPLERVAAEWLAAASAEVAPRTLDMYEMHFAAHLMDDFPSLESVTPAAVDRYIQRRLRQVKRETVNKELSTLRQLLKWAERNELIDRAPHVRSPAKRATGTSATTRRHIDLSADLVNAILGELPERTKFGNPARAYHVVMWETALRPSTLNALSAPWDYRTGATELRIRGEIDKARFARSLPLSPESRDALDSVCPDDGLIFGRVDYRHTLQQAAIRAGLPKDDALHVGTNELRHAALMDLGASTTDLTAIAYLAGHKHVITTTRYVKAREEGAARALSARAFGTRNRDQRKKGSE